MCKIPLLRRRPRRGRHRRRRVCWCQGRHQAEAEPTRTIPYSRERNVFVFKCFNLRRLAATIYRSPIAPKNSVSFCFMSNPSASTSRAQAMYSLAPYEFIFEPDDGCAPRLLLCHHRALRDDTRRSQPDSSSAIPLRISCGSYFQTDGRVPDTSPPASCIFNFCALSNHTSNSAKQWAQVISANLDSHCCACRMQVVSKTLDSAAPHQGCAVSSVVFSDAISCKRSMNHLLLFLRTVACIHSFHGSLNPLGLISALTS